MFKDGILGSGKLMLISGEVNSELSKYCIVRCPDYLC